MKIRTEAEIQHALEQLEDAYSGAVINRSEDVYVTIASIVRALRWVSGSDEPGGFGEMLSTLDRIDQAKGN